MEYFEMCRFKCEYEQNGEHDDSYNWSGLIRCEPSLSFGKGCRLEGSIIDEQVDEVGILEIATLKQYTKKYTDERYLLSAPLSAYVEDTDKISFIVFPKNHAPIDYEFKYDSDDRCYYGVYYFVTKEEEKLQYDGFAKLTVEEIADKKDISIYAFYKHINELDAFYQHDSIIDVWEKGLLNLQKHDENSDERFDKAKEFFQCNVRSKR